MARSRQKAKQRKAKRLAEEQKQAQRKGDERADKREERLEEIEEEGVGRESMTGTGIAAEVELDQARMDADLQRAEQETEGDEEPAQPHVQESARAQRKREKAAQRAREANERAQAGRTKKQRDGSESKAAPKRERGSKPAKQQAAAKGGKKTRERGRVLSFFSQVWAELKRVQWPTRDQLFQATGVVVGFCVVAGLFLSLTDFGVSKVIQVLF